MYPQYHNMIPLVLYLNHHYDFYRTVKIISGIITMIYSAVNHSYDSDRTIKIIPGIITMIYSAVNDSYDSDRTIKIISGIITMIYSDVNDSYDSNRTTRIISGIIPFIGRFIHRYPRLSSWALTTTMPCKKYNVEFLQESLNYQLMNEAEYLM